MDQLSITRTPIPGLLLLYLPVLYNEDGWFKENWHREKLATLGMPDFRPVQQNFTHVVDRGVTRGFHAEPWDRVVTLARWPGLRGVGRPAGR